MIGSIRLYQARIACSQREHPKKMAKGILHHFMVTGIYLGNQHALCSPGPPLSDDSASSG